MAQKLFISYSRQQTPFIDRLAAELEKAGHPLWLDYRSLVPAKPWYDQIKAGITGSEAFLLVVSKGSVSSPNVEPEWRLALELKERVILLIFDAVPLPPELQNCEWVDFRTDFKKSLAELKNMLDVQPVTPSLSAPQSGIRLPKRFWLALVLTVVIIITSTPAWWTILIPLLIIPLPWQIYKRNYMYSRIIPALAIFPIVLATTLFYYSDSSDVLNFIAVFISKWGWVATFASWSLLGLFMSSDMQLRMRPEAARVRFANPAVPEKQTPRSALFAIDYAAEDERYAAYMTRGLKKYGHRLAGLDEKPEAVFVLISTYKKSTQYDPEKQSVFPVLLQAVGEIDENLQRIQWIDFRRGTKNIDKVALLLPEPERMLKALAIAPTGSQEIMPLGVTMLQYYFLFFGILGVGASIIDSFKFFLLAINGQMPPGYITADRFIFTVINAGILFMFVANMVRALRSRSGGASFYSLFISISFLGLALLSNVTMMVFEIKSAEMTQLGVYLFPFVSMLLVFFLLFRWRDVYNWFPRRQDDSTLHFFEKIFLLYTPRRLWVLVLHSLLHLGIWVYYLAFWSTAALSSADSTFLTSKSQTWLVLFIIFGILLIPAGIIVFLARLLEKKK